MNMNENKNRNFKRDVKAVEENGCQNYGYYSKVLNKPFDSLNELRAAEEAYYAQIRAKEDKASAKKSDAQRVEAAFKELNAARKAYREKLLAVTETYRENLQKLKAGFESEKAACQAELAKAETAYSTALKTFTDKYPEGYHLTLKDGDFEAVIDNRASTNKAGLHAGMFDLFDLFFGM